jgi:hypothetical protein
MLSGLLLEVSAKASFTSLQSVKLATIENEIEFVAFYERGRKRLCTVCYNILHS